MGLPTAGGGGKTVAAGKKVAGGKKIAYKPAKGYSKAIPLTKAQLKEAEKPIGGRMIKKK